jgi:ArsR family transcriptional regulator, cadmium/lead-responsive transcriptional repressor
MSQVPGESARLWAAIADPMRLRLIDALLARADGTATDLAADLPISRQGVAKHLAVLEAAGLVARRRVGREVRFAVRPDTLDVATRRMAEVASGWDVRLTRIKALAESTSAGRRRRLNQGA